MKNLFTLLLLSLPFCGKVFSAVNLQISGGIVTSSMTRGNSYSITVNVKNIGSTSTSTSFYINVSLNSASTYNGSQTYLTDILVSGGVSAGATKTVSKTITIPSTYPTGSKFILVGADATKVVSESSETDNNSFFSTTIQSLPDLYPTPSAYQVSGSPYLAGKTLTTSFSVGNQGTLSAGSHSVGFYLNTSNVLNISSAIYLGNYSMGSVAGLTNSITYSKSLALPCGLSSGNYYLWLHLDNQNSVSESIENNNSQYIQIYINNPAFGATPNTTSPGSNNLSSPATITSSPTLSWQSLTGIANYKVSIKDETTNTSFSDVCVSATSYALPSSSLVSGRTYSWCVTALNFCPNTCLSNISAKRYILYQSCSPTNSVLLNKTNQTICAGLNTTVTATPNGSGSFTYQWKKNGVNLTNSSLYTGVNTATLSISNTPTTATGTYTCTVNGCNSSSATSSNFTLNVTPNTLPIPEFNATSNTNINSGQSLTFAPATGSTCSGCTYSWGFTGGNISFSTSQSPTVTYSQAGSYQVSFKITNSCGQSTYTNYQSGFVTVKSTTNPTTQVTPPSTFINNKQHPHATVADPVKIPSCDFGYDLSLISMNTRSGLVEFKIYYNSNATFYTSNLGKGYTHNFDFKIKNEGDTIWNVHYGSGYDVPFVKLYNGGGKSFPLYQGVFEKLSRNLSTGIYTLKFKNQIEFIFDSTGRFDYIKDRNNNITDLVYGSNGDLTQIIGAGGRTWNITNTNGKITKITDSANRSINISYSNGDIASIFDADSLPTQYQYTANHLMTKIILPKGNTLLENLYDSDSKVYLQYDGYNKPTYFYRNTPSLNFTKVVFPDGKFKVYQSDSLMRIIDEQDEDGYHIKHGFYSNNIDSVLIDKNNISTYFLQDSNANITRINRPLGVTSKFEFNTTNDCTKEILPEGHVIRHIFDTSGNEIQTIKEDSTNIWRTFTSFGQLKTIKNQLNLIDSFGYNSSGDNIFIKTPSTGITTQSHTNIGWVKTITNSTGYTAENFYNKRGHKIQYKDFDAKSIYFEFDANGNNTKQIDKKGYFVTNLFDVKDRNYASINIYGDTIFNKIFTDRDFVLNVKDANGNTTIFGLDGQGRTNKITNALSGDIEITIDGNGNTKQKKDVVNNITTTFNIDSLNRTNNTNIGYLSTSLVYNKNSWVTQSINAQGKSHFFTHSAIGKILNVLDPNQRNTSVQYNELGSPKNVTDPNTHTTHTAYDLVNRPFVYIDALGNKDSNEFDQLSNITKVKKANGVVITKTYTALNQTSTINFSTGEYMNYTYDDNSNINQVVSQAGTQSYQYDSLNRVKKYTDVFGNVIEYRYDKNSNLIRIIYGSNKILILEYNQLNQVKKIIDWNGKVWENIYNNSGRLLRRLFPNGMRCEMQYDSVGLLINKTWLDNNNNTLYGDTITRNAWGDIEKINCGKHYYKIKTSTTYGATYNDADHIITDSLGSHLYDKSGSDTLIQKDTFKTIIGYTANNMLKTYATNGLTYSNQFDAFFNRIQSTINGKTTRYINSVGDGGLAYPLMEQNTTGVITAYNIFGGGLLVRYDSTGRAIYYITDVKHNIVALVNDSCKVTDRYTYTNEGKIGTHIGNTAQPYTWQGEGGVQNITDSLYYVRLRVYNASNSRFYGRDAYEYDIQNPQTINRYIYALNNSANIYDWSGLCGEKEWQNSNRDFQVIANILLHEGSTNNPNEYLWLAHTAKNFADSKGKSLYSVLNSGYSSVSSKNKIPISSSDNSIKANLARAGAIDAICGGLDPTGGAKYWDGSDFIAWGLSSPNGTPQNKFEEYKSITIPKKVYDSYLNNQLENYSSGKINYSGKTYSIPDDVFTDKSNWINGSFYYNTGVQTISGIEATGAYGQSIFWKTIK